MGRKVLTIGKSSYAITLPQKFIQEHDLQPGEELHVSHQGNQLVIYPSNGKVRVHIDFSEIKDPDEQLFWGLMRGLFLYGAQEAKLKNVNKKSMEYLQQEIDKPHTNFYIQNTTDHTIHLRCPITTIDTDSFDNLIQHSLRHIYKSIQQPELRKNPQLQQLNLTRRSLSQRVESRTHLSLYSFVEKLELITDILQGIEAQPSWLSEYAHAIYLMQQISRTHNISEINKLFSHLQQLENNIQHVPDSQEQYAKSFLRYLKHANGNLLIAYA